MSDAIAQVHLSLIYLPLAVPISDAKVLTGRQKPLTEIAFIFAQIKTRDGIDGIGFGYSKRAGGEGMYFHAKELAPHLIGEDPNDIAKLWTKLMWAGASAGRAGITSQAIAPFDIALWDLKAKRAGLSVAKLIGAQRESIQCYNTSGGYLHSPLEEVLANVEQKRATGIGGIKLKVGQPNLAEDVRRVAAVREQLGPQFALMVDANQQWDRPKANRACRALEPFNLTWIEEPLDAYDIEGHAQLTERFDAAIATGEMLTSFGEHAQLIMGDASDFVQPDAPRVGGITPFLQIMQLADFKGRQLAPHFAMEIHVHLAACYPQEPWLEHFEWLEPLFNEKMNLVNGRMQVPVTPGLGISLSEQAIAWRRADQLFKSL